MFLLTVSLLIDGLMLIVNSPTLVKNEKKPFVLVQTRRTRMDVRAQGVGRRWRCLLIGQEARPRPAPPFWGQWAEGRGPGFSVCACVSAVLSAGGGACVRAVASHCR